MEHPLVSVIIPVYNTESYLEKCLTSLENQTYSNMEIIVVDDGSTDSSKQIAHDYAQRVSNFHCFTKENGGLSSARNYGIDKSSGEFIGFVDSDDWVEPEMFEHLMSAIESNNAEMAICDIKYITADGEELDSGCKIIESTTISPTETLELIFRGEQFRCHAVNKLYKRSLFEEIRFPLGKVFEDIFTTYRVILKSDKIALTPGKMYNYLKERPDSILTKPFSPKFFHAFEALAEIEKELSARGLETKLEKSFNYLKVWTVLDIVNLLTVKYRSSGNRKALSRELASLSKKMLNNVDLKTVTELTRTQVGVVSLSMNCPGLFFPLYNIYLKFRRR